MIPKFAEFLSRRQVKLPWSTQMLLDVSAFVQGHGAAIAVVLIVVALGAIALYANRRGRLALDQGLLWIPIFGDLLLIANMQQFSRTLGMLLKSGLTLLESLPIAANVLGNRAIARCANALLPAYLPSRIMCLIVNALGFMGLFISTLSALQTAAVFLL